MKVGWRNGGAAVSRRATTWWTPALITAAGVAVSCASSPPQLTPPVGADPQTQAQPAADQALANTVYSTLNADPWYFYRHVDVRVESGVATLSGYVWSTDAIYHARKIALQVPGVTRVVTNQLELERNGRNTGPSR